MMSLKYRPYGTPSVNMYKPFMYGMQAVPYIGDLARKVDDALPFW